MGNLQTFRGAGPAGGTHESTRQQHEGVPAQSADAIRAERLRVLSSRVEFLLAALRLARKDLADEIRVAHD